MGSPKKKELFTKPASWTAVSSGGNFPVALSFGDNGRSSSIVLIDYLNPCLMSVPIYDATQGDFGFNESDFASLHSLPLYRKGSYNLLPYAVVTMAYMVTSFAITNSPSANMALLFNVLFAVMLAEKINDEGDL